jgi:hypothetical protein
VPLLVSYLCNSIPSRSPFPAQVLLLCPGRLCAHPRLLLLHTLPALYTDGRRFCLHWDMDKLEPWICSRLDLDDRFPCRKRIDCFRGSIRANDWHAALEDHCVHYASMEKFAQPSGRSLLSATSPTAEFILLGAIFVGLQPTGFCLAQACSQ